MSQKANPTLVGSFVIGAAVLLMVGIAAIGSGLFSTQNIEIVTFFDGSVAGLNVGAPVTARGVRVGSVTSVRLEMDVHDYAARVPVYMELDRAKISYIGGKRPDGMTEELVKKGLRAQLVMQSFVTGQLSVDLDFHPGTPATLVGSEPNMLEVPAIKSQIETLKEKFDDLPFAEIADTLLKTLKDVDAIVSSPDVSATMKSLAASVQSLQGLIDTLQRETGPFLNSATQSSDSLRTTLVAAQGTIANLNTLLKNVDTTVGQLSKTTDITLKHADSALTGVNSLLGPGSQQRADIDELLRNLARTSGTLKSLVDGLQRNPNALIIGNHKN